MRRVFRKGVAAVLAAAMVVTLAPASADAAKKPSIAKKASVKVGKSTTIKVKNGKAKATVTWKTSKKSVAKLGKQVKKGNKASVVVKGVKKGKATITATYKLGKKKTNLKCVVTVSGTTTPAAAATTAPAAVATATATAAAPTATATANPTEAPTKEPSATPKPTPTASPKPKNTNLDANKLGLDETQKEIAITVDGNIDAAWEDSVSNPLLTDITKTDGIRGGESKITDATAKILWGEKAAYVLVEVTKANPADTDSVTIYFNENAKATEGNVQKATIKAGEAGKSTKTDKGYVVEAKFDIAAAKEVDSTASIEIQINEGNVTTNYYDTRSAMVPNADGVFELGDAEVTVDKDPAKMGQLTLLKSMAQSTLAYKTDKGAEIRAAADIDNGTWDVPAEEGAEQTVKSKKVTFVDPKYWTEAYGDNPAIKFPNYNPNAYAPEDRKSENITLMKEDGVDEEGNKKYVSDPELAKGYVIWDEDYIYVMFDIKDADVTVNDVDNPYLVDSTEFFLDEDNSKPSSYSEGQDEIQVRVAAIDNAYSSNDTNTGNYELVAHAAKVTEGVGYQTQYIIKLNNKHKHGDIMGMDLQVNDCSSIDVTITDDEGNEVPGKSSARACTITAYDTDNEDWQNPSYFGRVKLIDPNAAPGDETPGDETPGDETPGDETPSEVVTSDALVLNSDAEGVSNYKSVEYVDGTAKLVLAPQYAGGGIRWNIPEKVDFATKKLVITYNAKDAYPIFIKAEANGSGDSVWSYKADTIKEQYGGTAAGDGTIELTADSGVADAIFFKYNTWVPEGQTAREDDAEITIKSIKILDK